MVPETTHTCLVLPCLQMILKQAKGRQAKAQAQDPAGPVEELGLGYQHLPLAATTGWPASALTHTARHLRWRRCTVDT